MKKIYLFTYYPEINELLKLEFKAEPFNTDYVKYYYYTSTMGENSDLIRYDKLDSNIDDVNTEEGHVLRMFCSNDDALHVISIFEEYITEGYQNAKAAFEVMQNMYNAVQEKKSEISEKKGIYYELG